MFLFDDDPKTGKLGRTIKRNRWGDKIGRPAGVSTPCGSCPKESPEMGAEIEKKVPLYSKLLDRYYEIRATGATDDDREPILRRRMGVIDRLVKLMEASMGVR